MTSADHTDPVMRYFADQVRDAREALLAAYADLVGSSGNWLSGRLGTVERAALLEEELLRLRALVDIALDPTAALLDRAAELELPGALDREERMQWLADKVLGEIARRNEHR
jgi:hypothetical protein